jgi:hypothetical protein
MVFNAVRSKNRSSRLGVSSALVGDGTTIGSFLSGYLSSYVGFTAAFAIATARLLACASLIAKVHVAGKA